MKYLRKAVILPIKFYQILISPILGNNCRFVPSCSTYMIEAIEKFGVFKGLKLGFNRIRRCHPWGDSGYDPIP